MPVVVPLPAAGQPAAPRRPQVVVVVSRPMHPFWRVYFATLAAIVTVYLVVGVAAWWLS